MGGSRGNEGDRQGNKVPMYDQVCIRAYKGGLSTPMQGEFMCCGPLVTLDSGALWSVEGVAAS